MLASALLGTVVAEGIAAIIKALWPLLSPTNIFAMHLPLQKIMQHICCLSDTQLFLINPVFQCICCFSLQMLLQLLQKIMQYMCCLSMI